MERNEEWHTYRAPDDVRIFGAGACGAGIRKNRNNYLNI
jgi:hypothetical protein